MVLRCKFQSTVLTLVVATFLGCHSENADDARIDDVEVIPALSGPADPINVQQVSSQTVVHQPRLQLHEGDQTFYRRIVEQQLHEQSEISFERVWERAELLMSLTVRETSPDFAWIEVAFHEVRYQHELGSHRTVYDSRSQADIPPEALVYSGLKGNGFAFKLDAGNTVVDLRGFDEFLSRCYRSAQGTEQQEEFSNLREHAADPRERIEAAMSFLDESIAFVPLASLAEGGAESRIGSKWELSSARTLRVPTEEKLELGLLHVSGDIAHFKLSGTVQPIDRNGVLSQEGIRSRVIGGTLTGSCSISTRTGFPKNSSIQRTIDLEIASMGATPIVMRKSVVSTFEELRLETH